MLCEVLGVVRSSYYKWTKRETPSYEIEDRQLMDEIIHIYNKHKGIYGYRRIHIYLRVKRNIKINHKRVYRLMKLLSLSAVIRKKRKKYIKHTPEITAENVLNREFEEHLPNKKWLADVTEFKLHNGLKAYLSAIYDLGDKKIVGYKVGSSNNNKLVFDTFDLAVKDKNTKGIIFHSDRGFQYTSANFKFKLDQHKMIQSMSRVGKCIDNGPMESFWGILKCEIGYSQGREFKDLKDLKKHLKDYITFFNNDRISLRMATQNTA